MLAASECQQQVNAGCAWRWCRTCTADVVCVAATVTSICAVWGASLWMRSHDCPPALYQDTAAVEGRLRLALVHVMCAPHALCGAATASALCEAPWCCHRQVAAHHSAGSKRVPLALALVHCRQCVKQQSSHCRITSVCFVRPLDWLLLSLEPNWGTTGLQVLLRTVQ